MEPIDVEMDENCDTSNLQPESGIEGEKNCDFSNRFVMIKISKKEKTLADLHLKSRERIVKSEFEDMEIEKVETMSDGEIGENSDTSNIKLPTSNTSDHDEGDLSVYEKLRLRNIAERKAKFNELKIKDKVLDLSRNNRKKSGSIYKCDRDQCSKSYKSKLGLKNHIQSKHCNQCSFVTNHTHLLLKHKRLKHTTHKRTSALKKLLAEKHDIGEARFKCDTKRPFLSRESKSRRIKVKKSGNKVEKGSFCDLCNKSFRYSHELRVHVSLKHPVIQSFKCHLCPKVCGSQTGLDSRVTTHYLSESTNKTPHRRRVL